MQKTQFVKNKNIEIDTKNTLDELQDNAFEIIHALILMMIYTLRIT